MYIFAFVSIAVHIKKLVNRWAHFHETSNEINELMWQCDTDFHKTVHEVMQITEAFLPGHVCPHIPTCDFLNDARYGNQLTPVKSESSLKLPGAYVSPCE